MPSPIYITFKDENGALIKAGVQIKGREHSAEGHMFDYAVAIPADPNTGQLTAVRKHGDLVLLKNLDCASPILFDACCCGKTLSNVNFDWYRINHSGQEELYFTHSLSGVKVVKVRQFIPHVKDPHNDCFGHQEEVYLRFRRIEMAYVQGNIKARDDWAEARG